MKKDIQPKYNVATVTCSTCGNEFEVGTTLTEIKVDTCSNCHPFYTEHKHLFKQLVKLKNSTDVMVLNKITKRRRT